MAVARKAAGLMGMDANSMVVVGGVAIVALYMFPTIFKGFLGALNPFGKSDAEKAEETAVTNATKQETALGIKSAFNPGYYKQFKSKELLTQASTDALCKTIYDSVGRVYDTPALAEGAIKACNNKCKVSFLAERFNSLYRYDLLGWLTYHFDTAEQTRVLGNIINYVNALPVGGK